MLDALYCPVWSYPIFNMFSNFNQLIDSNEVLGFKHDFNLSTDFNPHFLAILIY